MDSPFQSPLWHLKGKPFEVQLVATEKAIDQDAFGLWLEMGMGKSGTTLNLFVSSLIRDIVDGMVVLCPNSLKSNWVAEADKWGVKVKCYIWPDVPKDPKDIEFPFMLAINYEAVGGSGGVSRAEDYLVALMKRLRTFLALDESVSIKSPTSARTKAALRLGKLARKKLLLSGNPAPQGPHDMWSQLTFLDAIKGFMFHPFKHTFCSFGGHMGKQVVGAKNETRLNRLINESGFRARKQDWLDLPEKMYTSRRLEMTKLQKKMYLELEEDLYAYIDSTGDEVSIKMMVTKLVKLQQIASGFVITDTGTTYDLEGGTPKIDEILAILEQTTSKILVPVFFTRSIDLLMGATKNYSPTFIRGQMKPEEIEHQKDLFNNYKDSRLCIVQMDSAKYGHTLIGSEKAGRCDVAAFYENTFSLDTRSQTEDRIHRIGQVNTCQYIDFVLSPIDIKIVDALQRKMDICAAILDGIKKKKAS